MREKKIHTLEARTFAKPSLLSIAFAAANLALATAEANSSGLRPLEVACKAATAFLLASLTASTVEAWTKTPKSVASEYGKWTTCAEEPSGREDRGESPLDHFTEGLGERYEARTAVEGFGAPAIP